MASRVSETAEWSRSFTYSLRRHNIVVSFTFRPYLPPGRDARVPTEQQVGMNPESIWTFWGNEKCVASTGNRTPIPWSSIR